MPGFNGFGPNGLGPRTGRGFGPCGRGQGMRNCYGRGYGVGYNSSITNEQEQEILNENMNDLQKEIEAIKARIKELGSQK